MESQDIQRQHYNAISEAYEQHYGDFWSQRYRDEFIHNVLFRGLDLPGRQIIDAMCGGGETTAYLLPRQAQVTGIDISDKALSAFSRKWPQVKTHCASIIQSGLPSDHFDAVVVVGGLHHLHPHVEEAVTEIHRILKKGGTFCFAEPHKGSVLDHIRKFWYKHDKYFAENEESIDLQALKQSFQGKFEFITEKYKGNVAYFFVFNSLVFRIPVKFKKFYSPVLMFLEKCIEKVQIRATSCFVLAQWRKA